MLFGILHGNSASISTDVTPLHPGWCYVTSDDGKFYIDLEDSNGVQKRICINQNSFVKEFHSTMWSGGTITIPASEHKLPIKNGCVGHNVFALADGAYTDQVFNAMDTEVSVDANKNVILSTPGAGYTGRVVLYI